ncbi:MAG: homocysteine S-methyltransferase family protein, partial [Pseudomonadota bacterium]
CGVGASDLLASVLDMTEADPDAVIVAKANCGIPQVKGDSVEYSGTPELMHDYVKLAIDAGAKIIGGCCGTSCEHLVEMRKAIDTHSPETRPNIDSIEARVGPLVNKPATADAEAGAGRKRGRRRRA